VQETTTLQRLKRATGTFHAGRDSGIGVRKLVRSEPGRRAMAQSLSGLHYPFETWIQGAATEVATWLPAVKSKMRIEALRGSVGGISNAMSNTLPNATILSSRTTAGTLIYTPENGCAFYSSYGLNVGEMWMRSRAGIVAYSSSHPEFDDDVIPFATQTLQTFEERIERCQ